LVAADFSLRLSNYIQLRIKQLRTLKGAATFETMKIGFIGQPLQIDIEWQPKGSRYERTGVH
jgi:hypothetical protein